MNWKDQLRKGNIVQTEYGVSEICAIAFGDFYVRGKGDRMLHAKVVEPVELGHEIMMAFWFKKVVDSYRYFDSIHYENESMWVYFLEKSFEIEVIAGCERFNLMKEFNHAHQLQNIFWELTGKQLEYKSVS